MLVLVLVVVVVVVVVVVQYWVTSSSGVTLVSGPQAGQAAQTEQSECSYVTERGEEHHSHLTSPPRCLAGSVSSLARPETRPHFLMSKNTTGAMASQAWPGGVWQTLSLNICY